MLKYLSLSILIILISQLSIADFQSFYFKSDKLVSINQSKKIIIADGNVMYHSLTATYYADKFTVNYQNLNTLDLEHIDHMEANGNVHVITTHSQDIKGDKYIYDLKQQVHVLQALNKHSVVYEDPLRKLTASDRIEYFINNNVVVVRGNPYIVGKPSPNNPNAYYFSSNLMNVQLVSTNQETPKSGNPDFSSLEVEFIEAINNVYFNTNGTTITANYAIYYKQQNQAEFDGNVVFKNESGIVKGCKAIYNLTSNQGKLIPCDINTPLGGTYKPKEKTKKHGKE
ncbi:hypothetical protein ACFX5K_04400 [Rickettsiales bacterium LUAb2]